MTGISFRKDNKFSSILTQKFPVKTPLMVYLVKYFICDMN